MLKGQTLTDSSPIAMSLSQRITEDLARALKAKDTIRISSIRMLKSNLKNEQIKIGRELKDDEIQSVLSSLIRKGREAAEEFRKGNREDLAVNEEEEIKIFYSYMPEQLKPEEIEKILKETISELSADGLKDMGKVMKVAMARMAGKAQGKEINEIVRRLLSESV